MKQFAVQAIVFAVIGVAVWVLSRLLRCAPTTPPISNPRKSSIAALAAVCLSMLAIGLLMLRQHLLHGPTGYVGPKLHKSGDLISQFVVLTMYALPAGFFMLKRRERLATAGITKANLWQAIVIGVGLAFLTFYFQPGGFLAKISRIEPRHGVGLAFYACVGFGEEFLFRGYLQSRLLAWLGKWRGWLLASAVMAAVHFPHRVLIEGLGVGDALGATIGLLPVSLLMGFVMLCTRNIVAPGLFHTFSNWVNTLRPA
jgi:membrane protease YdiL (CAAX protease family)